MNIFKRFLSNYKANTAIMFALAAVPITAGAGVALDYSNAHVMSNRAQIALDLAVLATANSIGSHSNRIELGTDTFHKNFGKIGGVETKEPKIEILDDGQIVGSVSTTVQTRLLGVIGITEISFSKGSEALAGKIGNGEVIFALDFSGSMKAQYQEVIDGAVGLVEYLTRPEIDSRMKFGFVPFAQEVHVTMPGQYVLGGTSGTLWSGCTIDRKWPWTVTDSTPTGSADSKWGRPYVGGKPDEDPILPADECANLYQSRGLVSQPLSTDHAATKSGLEAMSPIDGRPHGFTNTALAIETAFQNVSPKAPWTKGTSFGDPEWVKVIILLSDGVHNRYGFGPGGIFTEKQGYANIDNACRSAKKNDVIIVTIAYEYDRDDEDAKKAKEQLKSCATAGYFAEATKENVGEVFKGIGNMLAVTYLSR